MTKQPYTTTDIWRMLQAYLQPPQPNTILIDRACAGGDIAALASVSGYHVLAQDPSKKLYNLAQQRWLNAEIDWQKPTNSVALHADIIWAGAGVINQYYPNIQAWLNEQYQELLEGGYLLIDTFMEAECHLWSQQASLITHSEDFICYQLREYGSAGYTAQQEQVWFYRTAQGWQRDQDIQTVQAANQQELAQSIQTNGFTIQACLNPAGQPITHKNEPRIIWILKK